MSYASLSETILFWSAVALAVGIFGYVVGSFFIMRPHTDPRPFRRALREALRETFWVILTQPLLPLWYLVGRRMGRGRSGVTPVIFVHGYFQNRVDFLGLARALAKGHDAKLFGFNYPWTDLVPNNAKRLSRFVEQVCAETGASKVDLVCHSLGGVVALEYIHETGGERVRRCVTIASPHAGVAWKGPVIGTVGLGQQVRQGCAFLRDRAGRKIAIPCLSIYSTHDNVVHPPATSALAARGGHDFVVDGVGHLSLLFTPKVHAEISSFLRSTTVDAGSLPPPKDAAAPTHEALAGETHTNEGTDASHTARASQPDVAL